MFKHPQRTWSLNSSNKSMCIWNQIKVGLRIGKPIYSVGIHSMKVAQRLIECQRHWRTFKSHRLSPLYSSTSAWWDLKSHFRVQFMFDDFIDFPIPSPFLPRPPSEGLRRVKCTYSYSLLKLQFAAPKLRPSALRTTWDEKGKNKDSINPSKNSQYEKRTFLHWRRCCPHTFLSDWSRTYFCITRCFSRLCVRGPEADELTIIDISIWQKHTLSFLWQSCDHNGFSCLNLVCWPNCQHAVADDSDCTLSSLF